MVSFIAQAALASDRGSVRSQPPSVGWPELDPDAAPVPPAPEAPDCAPDPEVPDPEEAPVLAPLLPVEACGGGWFGDDEQPETDAATNEKVAAKGALRVEIRMEPRYYAGLWRAQGESVHFSRSARWITCAAML
jgi:hypothetical protein